MGNRWGNSGNSVRLYSFRYLFKFVFLLFASTYLGVELAKSLQMVTAAMKLKDAYSLEEKL